MDIKFGFADNARELTISAEGTQEELTEKINAALSAGELLELKDEKGRKYLVRTDRVIYVEVGAVKPQAVGFAGA